MKTVQVKRSEITLWIYENNNLVRRVIKVSGLHV